MTSSREELRELLDDAVREPARAIHVDAGRAWARGRRRRRTRVAVAGLAVAAALGGALVVSASLPGPSKEVPPAGSSGRVAGEHPVRLDYSYRTGAQPAVTGPLAGVVRRSSTGHDGWFTVSPSGRMWRLDATGGWEPSVSPDGVHLGSMHGSFLNATYRIADQVDGTVVQFPEIGTGASNGRVDAFDHGHRYFHSEQNPAFWSPDSSALLLQVGLNDPHSPDADPAAAVLGTDGSLRTIPMPEGAAAAHPVGWTDDRHVVLLGGGLSPSENIRIWVVDVATGHVARTFTLRGGRGPREVSQWFGSVSPDGNALATVNAPEDGRIQFYSLVGPTQGELRTTLPGWSAAEGCQPSWSSKDFFLPNDTTVDRQSGILARANGGITIVADPRLDIACSTWARTALDGPGHTSFSSWVFGDSTSWISWHWREITASALLAGALALAAALAAKRRAARGRVGAAISRG